MRLDMARPSRVDEMADLKTPDEYRARAQSVREQAADTEHESIKARFLQIAKNYEMIADLVAHLAATKDRLRRSE